jgi:hypothetical protein
MSNIEEIHSRQAAAQYVTARVGSTGPRRLRALTPLLPTGAFLLFDAWLGLVAAMIVASGVSVVLLVVRRREGEGVGILLPISLGYVVLKGLASVATESEVVYFGVGLALTALVAVTVGATAFTSRPAASLALPLVTPYRHLSDSHAIYRRVSSQVTALWALAELGITAWEAWHLTRVSASEFVVARSVVAWPVMGLVIFFLIFYVRFRLDRYERASHRAPSSESIQARADSASDVASRPLELRGYQPQLKGNTS